MTTSANADRLTRLPGSADIIVEARGATLVVTLNRPDRANALNEALIRDLRLLWRAARAEPWIRCLVLTGAGRAFCAGADMAMLGDSERAYGETAEEELSFLPGPQLDIPVIVAVNGVCAGGGLHFVTDADICIAAEGARFLDPHVTVGQVSGLEPIELLLRMRRDQVLRMALLGRSEVLDATAALASGLVSEVVAPEALIPLALTLADRIAEGSPEAIRLTRQTIREFEADLLRQHLDNGWKRVRGHWGHPDALEGPQAFQAGRPPRWS